ncbi:MAG: N-6 DNA methylase [Bacteroidetes bacterium]|nr:N-6 DNA methylase [Bacteroidota bacterium]
MALKKSELYSSLWAGCDELRGGMDASQYKDYVLVLLFVKYVSDKYAGRPFAPIAIPDGASFADMVALKGKPDIGDQINKKILGPLARENNLSDMPDFADPNKLGNGPEMVERLTNLIAIFENPALDFSKNRADGDDLLGDAYEYLMRHFATESGKSKGQFYTPSEVSRVIARILGIRSAGATTDTTVYDPTCGSGSLLLKVGDEAAHAAGVRVSLYGQEKDSSTAGLARMNMILHDYAHADIRQGNTLANPLFTENGGLKTFDYVVANPPFSDKRWSTGLDADADPFGRFAPYGVPPAKQGDFAYLLHILRSLKGTGRGACILPHGVLFRGNAEGAIRRNLVGRGVIQAIIGLPANLFFGTGIPACIIVLNREGAAGRKGIFMIDASAGFRKDGPKNRLREQDIHRIVDTFERGADIPGYARMVPVSEIADPRNDYNLNLPRYIESTEPEDLHDITAHLRGGIPDRDIDALDPYWQALPGVRAALFGPAGRPGYSRLRVGLADIRGTIFGHPEFAAFTQAAEAPLAAWRAANRPRLAGISAGDRPKALIETVAEDLLAAFAAAPLVNPYDIYQHLMDYWEETMQDDCYIVAAQGWEAGAGVREVLQVKNREGKMVWPEPEDYRLGKRRFRCDLIPGPLLVARFLPERQAAIDALAAELAAVEAERAELLEEQGGEGGLLAEVAEGDGEKRRIAAGDLKSRLGELALEAAAGGEDEDGDVALERAALERYAGLVAREAALKGRLKRGVEELHAAMDARYRALAVEEIVPLVVDRKWLAVLEAAVRAEVERVSGRLAARVRQLAERYGTPLPELAAEVDALAARVNAHLARMGAAWN